MGVACYIAATTALCSPVRALWQELHVILAVSLAGLALALVPALTAHRADVSKNLIPR